MVLGAIVQRPASPCYHVIITNGRLSGWCATLGIDCQHRDLTRGLIGLLAAAQTAAAADLEVTQQAQRYKYRSPTASGSITSALRSDVGPERDRVLNVGAGP